MVVPHRTVEAVWGQGLHAAAAVNHCACVWLLQLPHCGVCSVQAGQLVLQGLDCSEVLQQEHQHTPKQGRMGKGAGGRDRVVRQEGKHTWKDKGPE